MSPSFLDKLTAAVRRNDSLLCVGLDPDPFRYREHFPATLDAGALAAWGMRIVEHTADLVCCYKPNFAFYEQFGPAGLEALQRTIAAVPDHIPVLLDAKRGDIGTTAAAYARAAFEVWRADAVTVSPYLGRDGVAPFLAYPGKMAFVLAYTSNPSAGAVQEFGAGETRLFEHIVRQASAWGDEAQIGFVVGATRPQALSRVRQLLDDRRHWILAPGVGAQGGNLAQALAAGLDDRGSGLIVPVSRAVIYASDPCGAAQALRDQIRTAQADLSERSPRGPAGSREDRQADLILALNDIGCIQFGHFTLASGRQSPVYIDLRRLASHPQSLRLAAQAYAGLLASLTYDLLAAVPYAALTIGTAVALAVDKPLIYPRKEVKAHGTGRTVEGAYAPGQRAAVVEDLVTSGGSVLSAIDTLRAAGLSVSDVVVLIDREQGGRESLAAAGYRLHAALRLPQVLDTLLAAGRIDAGQAAAAQAYLNEQT